MTTSTIQPSFFELTSFVDRTLVVTTRKNRTEVLTFNIVEVSVVTICDLPHQLLISDNGDKFYTFNGKFHREDDQPAVVCLRKSICHEKDQPYVKCIIWLKHGLYHRDNQLPAVIYQNGDIFWFVNGLWSENLKHIPINSSFKSQYSGNIYQWFYDYKTFSNAGDFSYNDLFESSKEDFINKNFELYA